MQPTILYIHDPAALLSPEPLCSMWAALSPEESRAFRLMSCRVQRIGDWLLLLDGICDGRLLENRLRRLSRDLPAPVMHMEWDERLDELHLHVWQQGQQVSSLSADGVGTELPLLSRALGWAVTRERTDPQRLAALFSWTDAEAVRHLCSASRPAQALPPLTKLMGLNPLEAWRTIT
ncbi:MAG: hypothetical protein IJ343_15920 [Clostridia bacterium]|nr:hypothetical protein [Clostridia bacterium]